MIAVDTNVLVYAHREDVHWHAPALEAIRSLAEALSPWAIPWPCIHEFLAIVTHPRIFDPPTPVPIALDQVAAWLEAPSLTLLSESPGYAAHLALLVRGAHVAGPRIHDARIAALCLDHGVVELWTVDRDFSRFPTLRTRNPLTRG